MDGVGLNTSTTAGYVDQSASRGPHIVPGGQLHGLEPDSKTLMHHPPNTFDAGFYPDRVNGPPTIILHSNRFVTEGLNMG